MKNKLAENLLRFGIKNLNESEIAKLQGLVKEDVSSRNAFIAALAKLDPKAADVVKNHTSGVTVSNKYVLNYVPSGADANDGSGTLYVFKVGVSGGMPYIQDYGSVINRGPSAGDPSDIMVGTKYVGTFKFADFGGFNEVWNSLYDQKTQPVIDGALQFIGNNLEKFKKAFHQVTRSGQNYKYFWNDNPQKFDRSQYGMWMNKYKDNALKVIDLVQDDELMYNIRFKVKNFRSNGEYPELTIPAAVQ